jgi:hypothetical protein
VFALNPANALPLSLAFGWLGAGADLYVNRIDGDRFDAHEQVVRKKLRRRQVDIDERIRGTRRIGIQQLAEAIGSGTVQAGQTGR